MTIMRRILFTNPNFLQFNAGQSTFRMGNKWANLQLGEVVELVHLHDGVETVVGTAEVNGVVVGPYQEMLMRHGESNHEAENNHDAVGTLDEVIRSIYGDAVEAEATATVIYLRRRAD